ncbi:TetR/AcrR family transcriptional regulator [Comamonas testosteroni]|uniref:TetR/AcrR family transcriptional regulator n=1 Tax=Comamonas testosteroni TaxID=285 RepID=UPI00265F5AE4|nr:TetR/AcrR family transcriptional regulator [Comamonas testosteroni]WKL14478.1 TetR/AcrR family transcriptional regulator [Comamonas testosteroni]WQD42062.1 TetR/AcrR family transcriptional regulator [Comamonas testosteroni]
MSTTTARRRLTRDESRAQTREHLIDAARHLFVTNGYGGASIRDIANNAGYSQGAFYSNFSSKEDVLLELLRRHMDAEAMQLTTLMGDNAQLPEQMLARLEAWASTLNHDADWCMLSIELQLHARRSPSFATEYQKVWDRHQAEIGGVINLLFEKLGRSTPAEPHELAAAFMALSHGLALQKTADRQELTGRLIMVFLRGLIASST